MVASLSLSVAALFIVGLLHRLLGWPLELAGGVFSTKKSSVATFLRPAGAAAATDANGLKEGPQRTEPVKHPLSLAFSFNLVYHWQRSANGAPPAEPVYFVAGRLAASERKE